MSKSGLSSDVDGSYRATCYDCGWTLERPLDQGDSLSAETNREIVERVARNHSHNCAGLENDAVEVKLDMTGDSA